jgi:hypothetical protein
MYLLVDVSLISKFIFELKFTARHAQQVSEQNLNLTIDISGLLPQKTSLRNLSQEISCLDPLAKQHHPLSSIQYRRFSPRLRTPHHRTQDQYNHHHHHPV